MRMRLDKFVSQCSDLSRREVRYALRDGSILVNGEAVKSASLSLDGSETVSFDGQTLALPRAQYLMFNKPIDVVCARSDKEHTCVTDLLPPTLAPDLQLVGRLDKDTTGLLLLTDDGKWNHLITAPKKRCAKVYLVTTADPIEASAIATFQEGAILKDDPAPTLPAELELIDSHTARLTLYEGRYHQVKRMFGAIGNRVTQLHREAIAGITLDPALEPGEYRELTEDEVARVQ